MNLPQRFGLEYQVAESEPDYNPATPGVATPVMIHRAIFGSLERFLALLIEQHGGHWPFWLSPRQAIVLTVNQDDAVVRQAQEAAAKFAGFRALLNDGTAEPPRPLSSVDSTFLVDVDTSAQTLGKKIQRAKQMKYNLIFILGSRDLADGGITVDVTGQMQSKTDKDAQTLQALIKARLGNDALQNPRAVKLSVDEVHPLLVELEKNFV
jgi:threonyl-tRNA synthetase